MDRYLGSDPASVIRDVRSRALDWFTHGDAVAAYASSLLQRLKVHRGNVRELLASLLFQRIAAGFEAVLLLAERGMHSQGLVQRRSVLEALFVLGAIFQKPVFVDRFLAADNERVLGVYKKMKRLPPDVLKALEPEITLSLIEAKITEYQGKAGGRKGPSAADYAKAADLETYYLTDYSFSSEVTHSVAKDLERHIHLDDEGDVSGMVWGPENVPTQDLLMHAMDYALMACFAVEQLFAIGPTTELERLQSRLNELVENGDVAS
jgi:hypothetical protein